MKFQTLFILLIFFIKQITLLNQIGYLSGFEKAQKNCNYYEKENNRHLLTSEGSTVLNHPSLLCLNGAIENKCEEVKVSPKKTDYYGCDLGKSCFMIEYRSSERGVHFIEGQRTANHRYIDKTTDFICDLYMKNTKYGSIEVLGYRQKDVTICGEDFSYCTVLTKFGTCIQGSCRQKWDYKEESPHFTLKFTKEQVSTFINQKQFDKDEDDNYLLYLQGNEGDTDYKGFGTIERKLQKNENFNEDKNEKLEEKNMGKNLKEKDIKKNNLENKDNNDSKLSIV